MDLEAQLMALYCRFKLLPLYLNEIRASPCISIGGEANTGCGRLDSGNLLCLMYRLEALARSRRPITYLRSTKWCILIEDVSFPCKRINARWSVRILQQDQQTRRQLHHVIKECNLHVIEPPAIRSTISGMSSDNN
jgi:hypothetical protein